MLQCDDDQAYMSDVEVPEGGGHVEVEVVPAQAVLLRRPHPAQRGLL